MVWGSGDGDRIESGSCGPAHVAHAVEPFLGKEKVPGSNPGVGSTSFKDKDPSGALFGTGPHAFQPGKPI